MEINNKNESEKGRGGTIGESISKVEHRLDGITLPAVQRNTDLDFDILQASKQPGRNEELSEAIRQLHVNTRSDAQGGPGTRRAVGTGYHASLGETVAEEHYELPNGQNISVHLGLKSGRIVPVDASFDSLVASTQASGVDSNYNWNNPNYNDPGVQRVVNEVRKQQGRDPLVPHEFKDKAAKRVKKERDEIDDYYPDGW